MKMTRKRKREREKMQICNCRIFPDSFFEFITCVKIYSKVFFLKELFLNQFTLTTVIISDRMVFVHSSLASHSRFRRYNHALLEQRDFKINVCEVCGDACQGSHCRLEPFFLVIFEHTRYADSGEYTRRCQQGACDVWTSCIINAFSA